MQQFRSKYYIGVLGFAVLAGALPSCGRSEATKKVIEIPVLDQKLFAEETSVKLPKETEVLGAKNEYQSDGFTFTSIVFRMPPQAESVFGTSKGESPSTSTVHQITRNGIFITANYKLKDPNVPMKMYSVSSKIRGDGYVSVFRDGDSIIVHCSFKTPSKYEE